MFSFAALLLLAGCGSSEEHKAAPPSDPALTGPLGEQIMVDPELAGQARTNEAVAVSGQAPITVPPADTGPEAAAAAKAEALKLAGGAMRAAPAPTAGDSTPLLKDAATAAQAAEAAKVGNTDCAGRVEYGAAWANALPAPLAVYPRGAVQEAAGTDAGGCKLRVVHFLTAVSPQEVVNFYFTRLSAAGYSAQQRRDGGDLVLGGRKGTAAYVIQARASDQGVTAVDLISGG